MMILLCAVLLSLSALLDNIDTTDYVPSPSDIENAYFQNTTILKRASYNTYSDINYRRIFKREKTPTSRKSHFNYGINISQSHTPKLSCCSVKCNRQFHLHRPCPILSIYQLQVIRI